MLSLCNFRKRRMKCYSCENKCHKVYLVLSLSERITNNDVIGAGLVNKIGHLGIELNVTHRRR